MKERSEASMKNSLTASVPFKKKLIQLSDRVSKTVNDRRQNSTREVI